MPKAFNSNPPIVIDPARLETLRDGFSPVPRLVKPRVFKVKPLQLNPRRKLSENDCRLMYFLKHGSESPEDITRKMMSYKAVAKRMRIAVTTVNVALKRFERNGCRFVDMRPLNWAKAWERNSKIKGSVKSYLLSYVILSKWAGLSLPERVKELNATCGLRISPKTLSRFYHKHKISNTVVKYQYAQAARKKAEEIQSFAYELAKRTLDNENLIYFDETSVNMWIRARYTWSSRDKPVKMPIVATRGHGVTILGAIGSSLA